MGAFNTMLTNMHRIDEILSSPEIGQSKERVLPLGNGAHGVVFPLGAEYVVKCCYNTRCARDEAAHLHALFPYMNGIKMPECISFLESPAEDRHNASEIMMRWSALSDIFTLEKYENEAGRSFKAMIVMTHVRNHNPAHLSSAEGVGAMISLFHEVAKEAADVPCFMGMRDPSPTLDDLVLLVSGQKPVVAPFDQSALLNAFLSSLHMGLGESFSACKVICHHDLSPRNIVFSEEHVAKGVIDFVSAKPAARESEFAAFCLVPSFLTKVLDEYAASTRLDGFDPSLARLCAAAQAYAWGISRDGDFLKGLSCSQEILEPALSRQPAYRALGEELRQIYRKTYG